MKHETEHAVERMRSDLMYVESYRKRANALVRLNGLLRCETPGTVNEVGIAGKRWRRWFKGDHRTEAEEIILSDIERREFSDWCAVRAEQLRADADAIEVSYANGGD